MMLKQFLRKIRKHKLIAFIAVSGLAGFLFILFANIYIVLNGRSRSFSELENVPEQGVGLLLGSSSASLYFYNRVQAAVDLYEAGKIRHILVSGDNHRHGYNEPEDMKQALIRKGVPAADITCDYAGFRTLDSVVRAKKIFGLDEMTIISQRFHNYRALAIADRHGIDAVAYDAADVPASYHIRTWIREILARTLAIVDLYVIHRKPHFLGGKEPIKLSEPTDVKE